MEEKGSGSLLAKWKAKQQKIDTQIIEKANGAESLVLSHGQQRLWLLQQLHPENPFYNYSEAYRFDGQLDLDNLYKALQSIYDSHDVLRTTYKIEKGLPTAKVGPKEKLHVGEYDLSSENDSDDQQQIDKILLVDATRPFDLVNGPVVRFSLYKLSPIKYILLLNLHHIATDKWSMGIFRRQLAEQYLELCKGKDEPIETLQIQYHDYASWQRKQIVDQKQMDYWLEKLSGDIPVLEFPKNYSRPARPSHKGAFKKQPFSDELSKSVLALSVELETTPYVLLLSVYYVLLFRYTNQKDILIGSPISNRNHKSLENLIGFFNDTVVLRTSFESDISFKELVQLVRRTTLEAFANKDIAFEDLVKAIQPERGANVNPFFNVMFLYHAVPLPPSFGPELAFSQEVFDTKVAKFDLTLYIAEEDETLTSIFEYATDLFEDETIERLQEHFRLLLIGIVENLDEKISKIPMLSSFEKEFFLQNQSKSQANKVPKNGIHEIIGEVAKNNKNKKAVTFGEESITYKILNERAEIIAHHILKTTKGENRVIGLCIYRSVDMIVGLLGILKAGCAYLPLDPEYPVERIQFMLEDAEVKLTLSNDSTLREIKTFDSSLFNISEIDNHSKPDRVELPEVGITDSAYLIYTSGSSGKPKGVPISHQNIIGSTLGRTEFYGQDPDAFLLMSSISFDSSKAGIFWTLCTGGTLVISEKRLEQDLDKLANIIKHNGVSHTLMLPSLYAMLLEHADIGKLQSLKTAIVAGESCSASLGVKHHETLPKAELYNEYGPTEATVWCIAHKIENKNIDSVIPIGRPVAGANVYILSESLGLVPYGAQGEICIGGPGLSGLYLNRPDLTEVAYINNPFSEDSKTKLYKTGDLGRYTKGGNIEFLGRKDEQIKIRGYRVEIDEVKNAVLEHESVDKVVVVFKGEKQETPVLISTGMDTTALLEVSENRIGLEVVNEILESIEHLSEDEYDYLNTQLG